MSLLIELQYFPSIIAYSTLIKNTNIDFCLYENYRRRSFRNRCIIVGANGPISLSIPISGGRNQRALFKDVRIDYTTDWQQQHWRSIFSAYGKSPWFFNYADSLEKLFRIKVDLLVDWNRQCLDWINHSLGISSIPIFSEPLEGGGTLGGLGDPWRVCGLLESPGLLESGGLLESPGLLESGGLLESPVETEGNEKKNHGEGKSEKLDWRDKVLPANYQQSAMGPFPVYRQVFEERIGFQPNMSILDALFCCGKAQTIKLLH